jgi:hypothetical protein
LPHARLAGRTFVPKPVPNGCQIFDFGHLPAYNAA